jgi:hypothetical protein
MAAHGVLGLIRFVHHDRQGGKSDEEKCEQEEPKASPGLCRGAFAALATLLGACSTSLLTK